MPGPVLFPATEQGGLYPEYVEFDGICEGHDHFRDIAEEGDGRAEILVPMAAKVEEVALSMGNVKRVVNTARRAREYKDNMSRLIPKGRPLRILVAGLLSSNVTPEEIIAGYDRPDGQEDWDAMKAFMYGASNDEGNSVKFFQDVLPQLKAMSDVNRFRYKKRPMPLLVHAERKFKAERTNGALRFGPRLRVRDREWEAVLEDIDYIVRKLGVEVTVEHVSDRRTIQRIDAWNRDGYQVWGGIAPHYTEYSFDDLVEGAGFNAQCLCWPLFKDEEDRAAIHAAMLSGKAWYYFGSDRACHPNDMTQEVGVKINKAGRVTAGQAQIPEAVISYCIEKFAEAGKLEHLNGFLSTNGMRRFGLEAKTRITFKREDWTVPRTIEQEVAGKKIEFVVAMGGQTRKYVAA